MQDKAVYEQLAEKLEIAGRKSQIVPRILEKLLDEAEARLVLAAAPPATVEELSAKTGIDATKIEAMIDPLFRKGILFKSRKPDGTRAGSIDDGCFPSGVSLPSIRRLFCARRSCRGGFEPTPCCGEAPR
jgi:hypothetical protein